MLVAACAHLFATRAAVAQDAQLKFPATFAEVALWNQCVGHMTARVGPAHASAYRCQRQSVPHASPITIIDTVTNGVANYCANDSTDDSGHGAIVGRCTTVANNAARDCACHCKYLVGIATTAIQPPVVLCNMLLSTQIPKIVSLRHWPEQGVNQLSRY
jgi:hypothetical protein